MNNNEYFKINVDIDIYRFPKSIFLLLLTNLMQLVKIWYYQRKKKEHLNGLNLHFLKIIQPFTMKFQTEISIKIKIEVDVDPVMAFKPNNSYYCFIFLI